MTKHSKFTLLIILLPILFLGACQNTNESDVQEETPVPSEGVVEVDGFPLKYIRKGSGEPLLVIGSATYYPKAFSKELEENFELIFIDSRHFVPDCQISEEALSKVNLTTFSDDVEAVRKHLNLGEVGVVGHSVHAQIALDYADRYPDRVSKLIMIAGVPYAGEDADIFTKEYWETAADEERKGVLAANQEARKTIWDTVPADRRFSVSYHYDAPRFWADPHFDASYLLDDLRTCPQILGKLFGSIPTKEGVTAKLEQLAMPTLLILGKLDFSIPFKAWESAIEGKSHIKYVLMEEASHNPHTEPSTAAAFDRYLIGWVSSLK